MSFQSNWTEINGINHWPVSGKSAFSVDAERYLTKIKGVMACHDC